MSTLKTITMAYPYVVLEAHNDSIFAKPPPDRSATKQMQVQKKREGGTHDVCAIVSASTACAPPIYHDAYSKTSRAGREHTRRAPVQLIEHPFAIKRRY